MDRRELIAAERGTLFKEAETRIALVYPSPYRAAMSSLGYQQIYRTLHDMPGVAADRAMLDYAAKLTQTPARMTQDDVERLRQVGFDDRAILQINLIASWFNYINRVADGLGVGR